MLQNELTLLQVPCILLLTKLKYIHAMTSDVQSLKALKCPLITRIIDSFGLHAFDMPLK